MEKTIRLKLAGIVLIGLLAFGCACPAKAPEVAKAPECPECVIEVKNELAGLRAEVEALKTQINQLKVDVANANEASQKAVSASQKSN